MSTPKEKTVNIPRHRDDPFYRYKMPVLRAKVEGRGNGVKTKLVNIADIAKSLNRPVQYCTKWFGFDFGALTTIDVNGDRFYVNGKKDEEDLATSLDKFIELYVLCKQCDENPETDMKIRGGNITLLCKACGRISKVDMAQRLSGYILKNPIGKDDKKPQMSGKEARRQRRREKAKGIETKKEKGKRQESKEEEVVWSTDTSDEAVRKRRTEAMQGSTAHTQQLMESGTVMAPAQTENPLQFLAEIEERLTPEEEKEVTRKVANIAKQNGWSNVVLVKIIFSTLFDEKIAKQIQLRAPIMALFTGGEGEQKIVLYCIEKLFYANSALLEHTATIFNAFYDADVVEEELFLKWYTRMNRKMPKSFSLKIREKAKPFIEWLDAASEEEEDIF